MGTISVDMSCSDGNFHFGDPDGRLADPDRLRRLRETGLIALRGDPALDRLTGLAAQITGEGFVVICLVESTRQTFPSAHGLPKSLEVDRHVALSHSFSQYVVTNDAALVIPDAREHPVLRNNPSVDDHGVVAYAGHPLRDPDGVVLGALCLGESIPRVWSAAQLGMLSDLAAVIETEIALRLRARHALLCQARMQHVLDGVVDTAVLAADASGVVTVMNEGAEKLLDLRGDSVIGTQSLSYVLRSSQPLGPEPGEGQPQDWLMVDGAGRTKVVSIRSSVLRDSLGSLDGYILVANDVSSRRETATLLREAERRQREAIERLNELDRVRNAFIATANHELRTPLSSILGYTELLVEGAAGALSPEQLTLLNRVDANSKLLFTLIEGLLDLSRLDSRTPSKVAPMDANDIAEHAWETLQPHLAQRGLLAHLQICEASPKIIGDASQVERALSNMLQNAVKFTPDGGTVRLTVRTSSEDVEYEVVDTGIGIAEAEQPSVFDPFFRSQHADSLATPGAGIGLAIVRRIVEAHQGHVRLTSRPGSGTTIVVALPAMMREELQSGPERGVPFIEEPSVPATMRNSLEAELRAALQESVTQLFLHYQPIVDLTAGNVVAVEALVRWEHPVRGLLGPDEIIPLAEATGLIHQLGDWVLDRAVREAAALTHEGRELDLAVNFSVDQLNGRAVAKVRRALERSGLRPDRLILEVAESAFVEDEHTTAATYEALSRLGVKIAVDNFGTGYSSLLHLRRNPISALKIDRVFVAGIGESPDDEAICESIISLAGAVGASTVGEGVETAAQYAVLRSMGCIRGQGLLWSPAVPVDDLDAAFAACDEVPVAAARARMPRASETLPTEVTALIDEMHSKGASTHTIAGALNRTLGRHPSGVRWTAGAVARELPAGTRHRAVPALLPPNRGR